MDETWKDIPGYEGLYSVSDQGRVKSHHLGGRIMRPYACGRGYHAIRLYRDGVVKTHYVHRLVLQGFVGPCPHGMECCHNDGCRTNNQLSNLRWDTAKNNCADAVLHGTASRGERHGKAMLTVQEVQKIKMRLAAGDSNGDIAKDFMVGTGVIYAIAINRTWKHVTAAPPRPVIRQFAPGDYSPLLRIRGIYCSKSTTLSQSLTPLSRP